MEIKNINRWVYYNIDRIEEILETNKKAIILISGASSSGKSHVARILQNTLKDSNLRSVILSTDSYNKGISGIICDKVNEIYFKNSLENMDKIKSIVKDCIINTDFGEKFNKNDLSNIGNKIKGLMDKNSLIVFLRSLKTEFDKINFDEPSVYDTKMVASDINILLNGGQIQEKKYSKVISEQIPSENNINGNDIDVIIVEGIFSLENNLIFNIPQNITVRNFIEGNSKSLFLRRVIRDAKTTSADNCFTVNLYFKYIVPAYNDYILPNKAKADFIFDNDMTYNEVRSGDLYVTKERIFIKNEKLLKCLLDSGKITSTEKQRDLYFCCPNETHPDENILRLRTVFDEQKQEYVPISLIHKGAIKNRKDGKMVRPVNILIKEGDFNKIFESEKDFLDNMKKANFDIEREKIKTRYRIKIGEQSFVIDDCKNLGVYLEVSNEVNKELISLIRDYADKKDFPCEEIKKLSMELN